MSARQAYGLQVSNELAPGIERTVKWPNATYPEWKDRPKFA